MPARPSSTPSAARALTGSRRIGTAKPIIQSGTVATSTAARPDGSDLLAHRHPAVADHDQQAAHHGAAGPLPQPDAQRRRVARLQAGRDAQRDREQQQAGDEVPHADQHQRREVAHGDADRRGRSSPTPGKR